MDDSPDSVDAAATSSDPTEESRFPIATFMGAVALVFGGLALMMVYVIGTTHNFNLRADEPWAFGGIALQLCAAWRFAGVATQAGVIPPAHRSGLIRAGIVVSYVLFAATLLFSLWALAMIALS